MITINQKQQGDGSDSWTISEYDGAETEANLIDRFMVFEDPGTAEIYTEKLLYVQRVKGGMNAYLNLMAEFRLSGQPREVNQFLEGQLESVRNEITTGQWITAKEKMDDIVPTGDLTQDIYDRIHLSITTYIDNNY